jgi:hypothetical protein
MNFFEILSLSAISGTVGDVILMKFVETYLVSRINAQIKHDYDLKMQAVERDYDLKFDFARKELERKATEHQIQFSKLHIDRAERLKEIYMKVIKTEASLITFTSPFQGAEWSTDTTRSDAAIQAFSELHTLISVSRIYFTEALCTQLEQLTSNYNNVISGMNLAKWAAREKAHLQSSEIPNPTISWLKEKERVQELSKARKLIESEFRKLLLVE